jgi:hypothetical protein
VTSKITRPLPIANRVATAGQLVVRTRIFLDLWDFYHGPSRAAILDAMNRFSEFFRFDEHAHRFSFFVHAAALFEKKSNTINLRHLTKELRDADRISDQELSEIDRLFASVAATVKGIYLIRNKALAHRADSISFDKAFANASITTNNLRDLMTVALKIVNVLLGATAQNEQVFAELPLEDARAILAALSRT